MAIFAKIQSRMARQFRIRTYAGSGHNNISADGTSVRKQDTQSIVFLDNFFYCDIKFNRNTVASQLGRKQPAHFKVKVFEKMTAALNQSHFQTSFFQAFRKFNSNKAATDNCYLFCSTRYL